MSKTRCSTPRSKRSSGCTPSRPPPASPAGIPGIRFEAITMAVEPTAAKHKGLTIPAIRFVITDRQAYRPVRTALLLIDEIRRQHPNDFAWSRTIDRLTGSDKVRLAIEAGTLPSLLEEWDREAAEFRESRTPYLLYR